MGVKTCYPATLQVEIISPLLAMALLGVESGKEQFKNQKSLINDLLNITEWKHQGNVVWVEIPYSLGRLDDPM